MMAEVLLLTYITGFSLTNGLKHFRALKLNLSLISLVWVTIQFRVTWLGKMVKCFLFLQSHFLDVFLYGASVVVLVICLKNAD